MAEQDYDVIVIGAGFAGAAAASALQSAGCKTVVLEARDRAGGRAFTRPFVNSADVLEFGGAWISPAHRRIRHYANKCDFLLRPTAAIVERRWHDGRMLRSDAPAAATDLDAYRRGHALIMEDARRYAKGITVDQSGINLIDLSMSSYLHRINATRAMRSQALAWWCISGNGDPGRISAGEFLSSCAHGDFSPEGMMYSLKHTLVSGAGDLVRRMIDTSGAALHLGADVESVQQFPRDVLAHCKNGDTYRAGAVIIALPLNVLTTIHFAPSLSRRKSDAIALGHGGRSFKIWIKAEGAKIGTLVTGGLTGLQWAFAERQSTDGNALIVGFGLMDGKFDPFSPTQVEDALKRFFPEARLLAWDWHDWVSDPYSRGTWLALPAASAWIGECEEWQPEDKLFFASADFAPQTPGWFESAIVSGEAAARAIIQGSGQAA
jgi:monoamine oxidase